MNIIRLSIKSQVLDLKTLPIFSPLKISVKLGIAFNCSLKVQIDFLELIHVLEKPQ